LLKSVLKQVPTVAKKSIIEISSIRRQLATQLEMEQSRIQVYWGRGKTTIHYDYPFDAVRVLIKLAG